MAIKIDYNKCCFKDSKCSNDCDCVDKECGCVSSCAVGAISKNKKIEINPEKCMDCGACVFSCPNGALELV